MARLLADWATMTRRFAIQTFGCRVNQSDSAGLARALRTADWEQGSEEQADLVVLNTCTVTHRSDADVRKAVHRLQRLRPQAKVVVTGCMAQRVPEQLVTLGAHGVLGNADKPRLAELAERVWTASAPVVLASDITTRPPPVTDAYRSRPFVKIQDGCDAKCTYCIIPAVRGPARSAPVESVVSSVRALVEQGHHEIVLTGVHLGTYGAHLNPPTDFASLVRSVLTIGELGRLRLSCIEPMAFPESIVDLAVRERGLAPHFHLPLQSGSSRTLKRMVRPYRPESFVEVTRHIRARLPHACLGTDVIVGFPGETDEEFSETAALVERADLDYVHVFSYSDREGTASTRLGPKVDAATIKARARILNEWSGRHWRSFLERQVGMIRDGVSLEAKDGDLQVLTDNYVPLDVTQSALPPNAPVRVRITNVAARRAVGELVA